MAVGMGLGMVVEHELGVGPGKGMALELGLGMGPQQGAWGSGQGSA